MFGHFNPLNGISMLIVNPNQTGQYKKYFKPSLEGHHSSPHRQRLGKVSKCQFSAIFKSEVPILIS